MAGIVVLLTLALGHWVPPLVPADRLCRPEPAAVRLHQMVPGHDHLQEARTQGRLRLKLRTIIVETDCREELEVLLHRNRVTAYSEIPNAHGVGESGVRMGSSAHPRTSSIFFTVLEPDQVDPLKETICAYCDACDKHMRMIQWTVEDVV